MSNASFLLMGWIIIFLIGPIYTQLGTGAMTLLVAGGLSYTIGTMSPSPSVVNTTAEK